MKKNLVIVPRRARPGPRSARAETAAAGAGQAQGILGAGAENVQARQRPDGHPRSLRHCPQGRRAPGRADRQRRRESQRGLAGGPDRQPAVGRHADPQRRPDRRGGRPHGRLARRDRRREPHRHRRRRALGVRPPDDRAGRRRGAQPQAARVRDRPPQGGPGAAALDRQEPAPAARAGEAPRGPLRRQPVRPGLPDRGDAPGLHDRPGQGLLRPQLRRGARPPLRGRTLRRGRRRGRRPEGLIRLEARERRGASRVLSQERARRLPPGSAGRPAIHGQHRHPGHRSVAVRLGSPVPHERPPGRLLLLAHHLEHPGAEGLHVRARRDSSPAAIATPTGSRSRT